MRSFSLEGSLCDMVRAHLDSYIDGHTSIETLPLLTEHLGSCAACDRELVDRQSLKEAVRRAVRSIGPPPGLDGSVRRRIRRLTSSRRRRSWGFRLTLVAASLVDPIALSIT